MKRLITTIFSLSLAVIIALLSSGCSTTATLTFNNAFFGTTTEPSPGYTETLKYSVKNVENYNDFIIKEDSVFKDDFATFDYDGTYESVLTVLGNLPEGIETNVSLDANSSIYRLKTSLKLKSTYKVTGEVVEGGTQNADGSVSFDDIVESEVYFLKSGHSFAPIYSIGSQKSTCLVLGEKASIELFEYSYKISYNTSKYKIERNYENQTKTKSYSYTFKSLIDNNQLLFAIRCLEIKEDASTNLPVVSPVYGSKQTLTVKNTSDNTKSVTLNGVTQNIPVKNLNFCLSAEYNTGTPHYAIIQKNSQTEQTIAQKALLLEYAAPLSSYGSFYSMGALVYTLTDVEIK